MKGKVIGKLIWKSQEEQDKELNEKIKSWKQGEGRDGYIVSAEGQFRYRKIAYLIKVLRYYNHENKFTTLFERKSEFHVVVEFPEETQKINDLIPYEVQDEFLYHDTLHLWNEKQSVRQQIKSCHKWAMSDIDSLLDGELSKRLDQMIKDLEIKKAKFDKEIKKFKEKQKHG